MAMKAKYAFGNLSDVQKALDAGTIDAYDILLLDGDTEPKIGWIDKKGVFRLVKNNADLSELEAELSTKVDSTELSELLSELESQLETQLETKVNAEEVDEKIEKAATDTVETAKSYTDGKVEAAINEHLAKMFEFTDVPKGALVDYRDSEIRIMCPANAEFVKQNVGVGGDANSYYGTLKAYAPNGAVGYIEHINGQSDSEILTDLKADKYGRKYQPTWLALAKYDEATDTWTYYGENSSSEKFIGWDYQIDWYDADEVMIASDTVRISLSNEKCHFINEPYYVGSIMKKVDTKIEEKLAEVESAWEIVEF